MIRKTALLTAIFASLAGAAWAAMAESTYWKIEAGADQVVKALDFVQHSDGNVYAVTSSHDANKNNLFKLWKRDTASGAWSEVTNVIPEGGEITCANTPRAARRVYPPLHSDTLPTIISFKLKLYVAIGYQFRYCASRPDHLPSHNDRAAAGYTYPEICIYEIDPAGPSSVSRAIFRGAPRYYRHAACSSSSPISTRWFNVELNNCPLFRGYLFKDVDNDGPGGNTLTWGGGGGVLITDPNILPPNFMVNTDASGGIGTTLTNPTNNYVYSTSNGTDWSLANDGHGGQGRGKDQYGRYYGTAIPDGYRYSHIIEFDGKLWDYYGYYNTTAPFAFTQKTGGIHTEPWSRFQMGAGSVEGTTRLFRVGFQPDAQKNFIYAINGTGGTWGKFKGGAAPNDGTLYWRTITVVANDALTRSTPPAVASDESRHNGLYATYSYKSGASYKSGVARYANIGSGWSWQCVTSTNDARVYTGAIFFQKNNAAVGRETEGVILVGTSDGVRARRIGQYGWGPDALVDTADDVAPPPQAGTALP